MGSRPEFLFSHAFEGIIWNTLVSQEKSSLVLEIRDPERKVVSFAALNYLSNQFFWKDVRFEEPWWINLSAIAGETVLFTIYTETNNPDQKSLLAYKLTDQTLLWWQNDFSITSVSDRFVTGYSHKFGLKELTLDVSSGKVLAGPIPERHPQNLSVIHPFHYKEGEPGFETVSAYVSRIMSQDLVLGIDYLEYGRFIFVSCYVRESGLANYLIVLTTEGEVVMKEKAGEGLKGIGMDTFFILEGSLFFVKNKCELVRYNVL